MPRFKWSPWGFSSFKRCGVQIREEPDFSYTLDHFSFCESIDQITFKARPDHEPVSEEEMSQLRGAPGALQWRAHQTGPHLSARLGQLQSEIAKATVGTLGATNKLVRECLTKLDTCQLGSINLKFRIQVKFVLWHGVMRLLRIVLTLEANWWNVVAATYSRNL